MSLRVLANSLLFNLSLPKKNLIFLLCLVFFGAKAQDPAEMNSLKKEAKKYFDNEEYTKAYPLYSQLVANYSKDPDLNYRLGVCMIYSEPDKKKCLTFLNTASKNFESPPKEFAYYLGKAYHINYLFDDAIRHYQEFKTKAPAALQKKLQVDREITACNNGKRLLSNLSDVAVRSKKQLNEADYFRTYDLKTIGGKLLVKPDEFKTSTDKKKKESSVVFLPRNSNIVYFSSYGESAENGKDIYTCFKKADGSFSPPTPVNGINTSYDEDYPFLHPDGKSLYFASKGHNSMGGYDIFKSVYDENTNTWSSPVNLEFPINSPDDDYLFVTDSLEQTAFFSTGRQSPPGKIDVLKINIERKPINLLAISGKVLPAGSDQPVASKVVVKLLNSIKIVGEFEADKAGLYSIELPKGEDLVYTVETPGFTTQTHTLNVPLSEMALAAQQTITYENSKLKVTTSFNTEQNESDYLKYLKVIEDKAKLEVNTDDTQADKALAQNKANTSKKNTTGPQIIEDSGLAASNPQQLAPKALAAPVRSEAQQSEAKAKVLLQDSRDAYKLADEFETSADEKWDRAQKALARSETLEEGEEKTSAIETANSLKRESQMEKDLAEKMQVYGKSLEEEAASTKRFAELNADFSSALGKSKSASVEADPVLKGKQNQVMTAGASLLANNYSGNLQKQIAEKEAQVNQLELSREGSLKQNAELKSEVVKLEEDLSKTKKKSAKETINNQIEDLKTEISQNEKQSEELSQQLIVANDELSTLKKEQELISRIQNESIASPPIEATPLSPNTNPMVLKEKYKDLLFDNNSKDTRAIEQINNNLKAYSSEIVALQEIKRKALAGAKTAKAKQDFNRDIRQLESMKAENAQQLTKNEYLLETLKKQAKLEEPVNFALVPINPDSKNDLGSQLDNLNKQLEYNDQPNFKYDTYVNETAKAYKEEADAAIRTAQEKQNKLKEESTAVKAAFSPISSTTPEQLEAESDTLMARAAKKRADAAKATGNQKTSLINEAKALELASSEKLLQASEIIRKDNAILFETNGQNINDLIATKNSTPEDVAKARNLIEEANISFKQGASMREEANSYASAGAKLGNISNAEEKELEAFEKQKEALDLLLNANPGFELKQAPTSSFGSRKSSDSSAIADKINSINQQLDEVLNEKISSYQKLFDANEAEISQLYGEVENYSAFLENSPSLKAEYAAINKKKTEADGFKQQGDRADQTSEKLSAYVNATRKQNVLIPQLNNLLNSLLLAKELSAQNPEPLAGTTGTSTANVEKEAPSGTQAPVVVSTISADSILRGETNTSGVLAYLEKPNTSLRNEQAFEGAKNAMLELKRIEREQTQLKNDQKNAETLSELLNTTQDPSELRTAAENYENESEQLSSRAFEKQKEANAAAASEKTALLKEQKELEDASMNQRFLAAKVNQKAFDIEYKTNQTAIADLKGMLSQKEESLDGTQEQLDFDIQTLTGQINKLKEEAAGLPNRFAQLGALSNVDEKERELIQKQNELIQNLRVKFPDYTVNSLPIDTIRAITDLRVEPETRMNELEAEQVSGLTNLTNALTLEYETSKSALPGNLSPEQQLAVSNADSLNEKSKQLLLSASGEAEQEQKLNKMNQAALLGAAALEQLSQVLPPGGKSFDAKAPALDELTQIGEGINGGNSEKTKEVALKIEGLEVVKGNAYSESKPIPFNTFKEEGLSFRVQIGAFRNQLPNSTFKGLSPLYGETTRNGYYRYTAGDFEKIEAANAVKNDLRKLGYRDAFVVAYLNGKRVTASEAIAYMAKEGKFVNINSPQSAGITENLNIPRAILTENEPAVNPADLATVSKELEQIDGLLYTIQIGVYSKQATKQSLLNLQPLFTKQLPNGLYRYTTGIYNDTLKVVADRNRIVELGINDAFIGAYLNGNSISFTDGKKRQNLDPDVRMEQQQPVIFPELNTTAPVTTETPPVQEMDPNIRPFTNAVNDYPEATEENAVKTDESGISYKVQIGAFSKQVPNEVASKFMLIKNWPVENKAINGLYIYNVGNFSSVAAAQSLKNELVQLGISDAFVVVYRDGRKLYGAEASTLLTR